MNKCKDLFCGIFNFYREVYVVRSQATTERKAWANMCFQLAKKKGISPRQVMQIFDGTRDNFSIQLEMEFTIDDEDT